MRRVMEKYLPNVYVSLLKKGQRQPSLNAAILIAYSLGMRPEELIGQACTSPHLMDAAWM